MASFVTGGLIPEHLRGTSNNDLMHVADWYVTFATLASVDPKDAVTIAGMVHDVDGVNVWPLLTRATLAHPRSESASHELPAMAWVPTTEYSILSQQSNGSILKLITAAKRSNFWLSNGTHVPDNTLDCVPNVTSAKQPHGPCAGLQASWYPQDACCVCSIEHPCLFDVTNDPAERENIAAQFPSLVRVMETQLAKYTPYVDGRMTPTELTKYDCSPSVKAAWNTSVGTFVGPCCKPKN